MTLLDASGRAAPFSWKGRSAFVTGAAGFVGSWLSEKLVRQGAMVTALVWPGDEESRWKPLLNFDGVQVVRGLVEDSTELGRILLAANADTVFHLAAINVNTGNSVSPVSLFETNIRGTWSVLEACRLTPTIERIVIASSREAEDMLDSQAADTPTPARRKRHPYQVSKMSAELSAQAFCDTYGLPVTISRSDNVYGGRDMNWNRLIPGTVRSVLRGEPPTLRSDGTLMRDYVFVEDMVNAYLSLSARAADVGVRGEVFHFATGISTSVLTLVTLLCELAGRPDLKPVILNHSANERVNQERSTERERMLLGWTSRVGILEGLQTTVEWYRNYFEVIGGKR